MARIRTIKPEFPQSESMGRVSRDARLLFVMLWTICDDDGRTRANSRMLASLLFPYDDDAKSGIEGWLAELERENCIIQYKSDGNTYLQIQKWQSHQRIDKPTPSKFPAPQECSRKVANTREASTLEGNGKEGNGPGKELARSADADEVTPAIQAYNVVAEELHWPQCQAITAKRRAALKARLAECGGIEGWASAMAKARASPFLRGETGRSREHEKWTPDLDFFLQQSSFVKLMEGKYDDRNPAATDRSSDFLRGVGNAIASFEPQH
jgi:hypothetical protein